MDEAEGDGMPPRSLRDRAYNTLIGLSLLPFAWLFTLSLFSLFSHAKIGGGGVPFWMSHEFLMFALGGALWLGWFFFSLWVWKEPRPLRVYVWGHEMMHAIWAKIFGGQIKDFEGWNRDGGYIVTDKYNFWIALVPYLYPFYSVPVLAAWGVASCYGEAWEYREWFFGLLGLTWMFHLSFTLWMLPRGQSDLLGPGRVFSLVWIYLVNLLLIVAFIITLAPEVTWTGYAHECWVNARQFYERVGALLLSLQTR